MGKMYVGPNEHREFPSLRTIQNASVLLREVMKLYNDNKSPYLSIATGHSRLYADLGWNL
jgi:hypothetical protein